MEKDNITSEPLDGVAAVVDEISSGKETVSSVEPKAISLEELNKHLGKNYKDPESALKSLKDTFSFVGKKIEAQVAPAPESKLTVDVDTAKQLKEIKEQLFYSEHPEYKSYRGTISKMGENPADVVAMPEFKEVFEKAANYDKIQKSKTVLESNPRMGLVRNKQKEAVDAISKRDYNTANQLAVDSVIEGLELGK